MAAVGDDDVAHGVEGIDPPPSGERPEVEAGVCRVRRRPGNAHDVPRRDPSEVVEAVTREVVADTFANRRMSQPLEHRRDAALLRPARQQIAKRIRRGVVRVLIAVDLEATAPRGLDLPQE